MPEDVTMHNDGSAHIKSWHMEIKLTQIVETAQQISRTQLYTSGPLQGRYISFARQHAFSTPVGYLSEIERQLRKSLLYSVSVLHAQADQQCSCRVVQVFYGLGSQVMRMRKPERRLGIPTNARQDGVFEAIPSTTTNS